MPEEYAVVLHGGEYSDSWSSVLAVGDTVGTPSRK
jgi:hypothetical protein